MIKNDKKWRYFALISLYFLKVGKPVDNVVNIPTNRAGPIPVGFEITPFLDGSGDPDIVDLNPPPKVVPTLQVGALGMELHKMQKVTIFGHKHFK